VLVFQYNDANSRCKRNYLRGKYHEDRNQSSSNNPIRRFHSDNYLRHNARRLEHLSSLGISVSGMTVLEVGAGIGDHSHYYLDRNCSMTITEIRDDNLKFLRKRYPQSTVTKLDLDSPHDVVGSPFDIVHSYGLLYHLKNPEGAINFFSKSCKGVLFLETCVSFGDNEDVNLISEPQLDPTQAFSGLGCRPTRQWIFSQLGKYFEYVYVPKTQPNHREFPIDWTISSDNGLLSRAVFIASRTDLNNNLLSTKLLSTQQRHY
jgi:Methyltransferase domain